jgi:PAS domain S-box-containing protein
VVSKNNKIKAKNKKDSYIREDKCNLLKKLIDSASDHIYIKDKQNRYVMVNKAKANFIGKNPQDFIGKTDSDFFPPKKAKIFSKMTNGSLKIKSLLVIYMKI